MINLYFFYYLTLILLTIFSYGLVDANFPIHFFPALERLIREERAAATAIYVILMIILFAYYLKLLIMAKRKELSSRKIFKIILMTAIFLLFSYPAFSYDIFNYIATAKVAFFYRENPYLVMPIELKGEPMLAFMHAANKTALYGPSWILLTFFPFILGFNNLLLSIFTFKLFMVLFYLETCYLIWHLSKKNIYSLVFFALNPLVLIETLVSSHNDIVMIFFALLAFYLLLKKKFIFAAVSIITSTLIKYATIIILPIFFILFWKIRSNKKINWQSMWKYCFWLMLIIFLLTPLREEMYPWYFLWPLVFYSLVAKEELMAFLAVGLSIGLELRFAPFLYFREWGGIVPQIKKAAIASSLVLGIIFLLLFKKWQKK